MIVGLVISYFVLLPTLTWGDITGGDALEDIVSSTFSHDVRFVGAGAIAIAAIWTLLKILGPIVRGIRAAAASTRARRSGDQVELTERDLPIWIVGGTIAASLIPIGLLLWWFLESTQIGGNTPLIIAVTLRVRRPDRRASRVRRGLHGRPDRLVQQPDLRARHPGRRHRVAGRWCWCTGAATTPRRRRDWWPTRCSPRRSSSVSPPSPTTTFRTSRPANSSAPHRGGSRSRW